MSEIVITRENFQYEVIDSDKPVLVDFWADWCMPCKMLESVISQLAEDHPEIKVGKCNVDEQMELATQFQVLSIPFIALFYEGKLQKTTVGYQTKDMLERLLDDIPSPGSVDYDRIANIVNQK